LLDSFSLGWKACVEKMEIGKMSGLNVNMHQKPLARVEKMEISASKSIVALLFDLVSGLFSKKRNNGFTCANLHLFNAS
jgi:hypothetical protein